MDQAVVQFNWYHVLMAGLAIWAAVFGYLRYRESKTAAMMDRHDEKFSKALKSHDEKNTEDFGQVRKDVAELKKEMKQEYNSLDKKVDGISRSLARIEGAREEKAKIMALQKKG